MTLYSQQPSIMPTHSDATEDYVGEKAGNFTIVGYHQRKENAPTSNAKDIWVCKCDCGMFELRQTKNIRKIIRGKREGMCAKCMGKKYDLQDYACDSDLVATVLREKQDSEQCNTANARLSNSIASTEIDIAKADRALIDLMHCLELPGVTGGEMMKIASKMKSIRKERRLNKNNKKRMKHCLINHLKLTSSGLAVEFVRFNEELSRDTECGIDKYKKHLAQL